MATPDEVRADLTLVASTAAAETRAVAASAETPSQTRAALFAAAPLIVAEYSDGSAALAIDWYEELRDTAQASRPFTPRPFAIVREEDLAAAVAAATRELYEIEQGIREETEAILQEVADKVAEVVAQDVADGFRDTITGNVAEDPDAAGWRRFARPEACKFCKMLAARGAVYTEATVRFAAHGAVMRGGRKGGNCMCIAGPAFGGKEIWAEASPMQYLASQRERSDKDRARLREYLNANFPDAPG